MVVLPGYSKIVEEYEKARKRAQVSRKISLFPSRPTWSLPGREITVLEKMYLQGPENLVKFYNRMEVCQNKTGRWIVYTTAESEKSQRISSSYVAVMGTTASQTPRFGRIVSLFQHTFAKQTAN